MIRAPAKELMPTSRPVQIVCADLAHTDTIAPLFDAYRQFYAQAPDAALARQFIAERLHNKESTILWARDAAGSGLGFCQMYPSFCSVAAAPIGVLYDLYVAPDARHRGVGRALLDAARVHALAQGWVRLDLTTAKTNTAAQALYRAMGWTQDQVFDAYNLPLSA